MKQIDVRVSGRVATLAGTLRSYVCDNSDYVLAIDFDAEWAALSQKTARFVYEKAGEIHHVDVAFSGNTVQIPPLRDAISLCVGVFAGTPGVLPLMSTTPLHIACSPSILSHEGIYDDLGGSTLPEPDDGMLYITDANGVYLTDETGCFYTMEGNE